MANMQKEYGATKGKSVFYATANKKKMQPADEMASKLSSMKASGKLKTKMPMMKGK